jgi:hypothetical protein
MTEKIEAARQKIKQAGQIRERIMALFCLTLIAVVAMYRIDDPENIVINVIVAIGSFVGGVAVGSMKRADAKHGPYT